ncbi:MAG TPA: hypothetical protein ENN99_03250, partial [Chloroflexi bacterium]|nr:hypothetical protein [Chloroflexota bacterium]
TLPLPLSDLEEEILTADPQAIPLHQIFGGHPLLAIVGGPGSGKSMLLAYVALVCARSATNDRQKDPPPSPVPLDLVEGRTPLCVTLPALVWSDTPNGEAADGIDRLINAAIASAGSGKGVASSLRQLLEAGQTIILVDGWDDLTPDQRVLAADWISQVSAAVPENWWLIGVGAQEYAPLVEAGFVPLHLAAWNTKQIEELAHHWTGTFAPPTGPSGAERLPKLTAALRHAAHVGATPLELALRAFVYLSDGQTPSRRAALFDRALELLLWQEQKQQAWLLTTCRVTLGQLALTMLQEERPTTSREEIEAVIEAALPPSEETPARAVNQVLRTLTGERGLLRPGGDNCYTFTHSLWQAYLAARQLIAIPPESLVERLEDPKWTETFHFYAEIGDVGPLVNAWLRTPDDLFHTRLRTLSTWISVAPAGASWSNGAMAVLARGFLQSNRPSRIRRQLALALAATGISGVTYLFKQALQQPDPQVRTAAITGLTRMAGEADLPVIREAVADQDPHVQEAAVRGLAYMNIDAAQRWLEQMVISGDELLSLIAAETLAQYGEEGGDFLREAITSENPMVRRAAVVGLAQIGARDVLKEVAREDNQWIVRSAASAAVEELDRQEKAFGITPPPHIEQLPWLISWAAAQGESVGMGDAAWQMLLRALREGNTETRIAVSLILAHCGRHDDIEPLKSALPTSEPEAADAILQALAQISERYGVTIT